jgi:hypothetical protein
MPTASSASASPRHLVQRRRGDLDRTTFKTDTPFPKREAPRSTTTSAALYREFFDRVLAYCREQVRDPAIGKHRQRVRWWSALALLRGLASSPAAAAATLRNRAAAADTDTEADADEAGRRAVLDLETTPRATSTSPPAARARTPATRATAAACSPWPARPRPSSASTTPSSATRPASCASSCPRATRRSSSAASSRPPLRRRAAPQALGKDVTVGRSPASSARGPRRSRRSPRRGRSPRPRLHRLPLRGHQPPRRLRRRLHYDLAWNPTRHEQREGRVDRYGHRAPTVRAITFYGQDNPIDGIVLEVLLRKHRAIHSQLGITVPVPMDTNAVTEAIFEGLLLRDNTPANSQTTFEFAAPQRRELDRAWNAAADRERQSRTIFAQNLIKVEELTHVLAETRLAIGDHRDVQAFVAEALTAHGAQIQAPRAPATTTTILLHNTPRALRDAMRTDEEPVLSVAFQPPAGRARLLTRTHPLVEGLASYVLQGALDPLLTATDASNFANSARRCAAFHTDAVATRTTLLLLRLRFHLITRAITGEDRPLLAEDLALLAFEGSPDRAATTPAAWLSQERARALTSAAPSHNIGADQAVHHLTRIRDGLPVLQARLQQAADDHGKHLLDAHRRVRRADARRGVDRGLRALRVEAHPPDVLGLFLLLPSTAGAAR